MTEKDLREIVGGTMPAVKAFVERSVTAAEERVTRRLAELESALALVQADLERQTTQKKRWAE
jgi:prefoldin subunit 5